MAMQALLRSPSCSLSFLTPRLRPSAVCSYRFLSTDTASRVCARIPNRALVAVTGSQASTFLNGLVANHVPPLESEKWRINGRGLYTAFLSPQVSTPELSVPRLTNILELQGRIMYDVFIYPYFPKDPSERPGFIVEYDPRAAKEDEESSKHSTPELISMLKRYILRAKVRVRDVTADWNLYAVWGSAMPPALSWKPDDWRWGRSGAVEPVLDPTQRQPLSVEEEQAVSQWVMGGASLQETAVWMEDRRAPGMGARLLLPKGTERPFLRIQLP